MHPDLVATIKATPSKGFALLSKSTGEPVTRQTLNKLITKAVEKAELPDR